MKLKIELDLGLSARTKVWSLRLGIPALALVGGGLAYATIVVPNVYFSGETLTSQSLNTNFQFLASQIDDAGVALAALQATVAGLQTSVAALQNTSCPPSYSLLTDAGAITACTNSIGDEVVKVGSGASAFWIDRYEASVWDPTGTTTEYGAIGVDGGPEGSYPGTFPPNGQRSGAATVAMAVSKVGVQPSGNLTWFQAMEACAAAGKQLPTGQEWLRAASGTSDPATPNAGTTSACNTNGAGPRKTGSAGSVASLTASCVSIWGAEDMIGNLGEWTAEWYSGAGLSGAQFTTDAGVVSSTAGVNLNLADWPDSGVYNDDVTYNVSGATSNASIGTSATDFAPGLPAAASRGGSHVGGTGAGIFFFNLNGSPATSDESLGFRCVIE